MNGTILSIDDEGYVQQLEQYLRDGGTHPPLVVGDNVILKYDEGDEEEYKVVGVELDSSDPRYCDK